MAFLMRWASKCCCGGTAAIDPRGDQAATHMDLVAAPLPRGSMTGHTITALAVKAPSHPTETKAAAAWGEALNLNASLNRLTKEVSSLSTWDSTPATTPVGALASDEGFMDKDAAGAFNEIVAVAAAAPVRRRSITVGTPAGHIVVPLDTSAIAAPVVATPIRRRSITVGTPAGHIEAPITHERWEITPELKVKETACLLEIADKLTDLRLDLSGVVPALQKLIRKVHTYHNDAVKLCLSEPFNRDAMAKYVMGMQQEMISLRTFMFEDCGLLSPQELSKRIGTKLSDELIHIVCSQLAVKTIQLRNSMLKTMFADTTRSDDEQRKGVGNLLLQSESIVQNLELIYIFRGKVAFHNPSHSEGVGRCSAGLVEGMDLSKKDFPLWETLINSPYFDEVANTDLPESSWADYPTLMAYIGYCHDMRMVYKGAGERERKAGFFLEHGNSNYISNTAGLHRSSKGDITELFIDMESSEGLSAYMALKNLENAQSEILTLFSSEVAGLYGHFALQKHFVFSPQQVFTVVDAIRLTVPHGKHFGSAGSRCFRTVSNGSELIVPQRSQLPASLDFEEPDLCDRDSRRMSLSGDSAGSRRLVSEKKIRSIQVKLRAPTSFEKKYQLLNTYVVAVSDLAAVVQEGDNWVKAEM